MEVQRYAEMKDSGVEWIGEIPAGWRLIKIRHIIQRNKDGIKIGPFGSALTNKTKEKAEYNIYGQANLVRNDFTYTKHTIDEPTFLELQDYEVLPGDICLSMMGTIGKCSIVPGNIKKGIMDSHLIKIRLLETVNSRYFEYVYDKDLGGVCYLQMQYDKKGSIMDGLNTKIVKDLYLPNPPTPEQRAIAAYLDEKCTAIDEIVAGAKASIEDYKKLKASTIYEAVTKGLDPDAEMKDSGVEWIGKMPKQWLVIPFTKYLDKIVDYRGKTPTKTQYGVFLVTAKNIKNGKIDYTISKEYVQHEKYEEIMHRGKPKIGDVLFTTEAPLGEVANVDCVDIALAQRIIKFSGKNEYINNYFLKYWIMSWGFQFLLQTFATGSTATGIKASKLGMLKLVLPPLPEQRAIVIYLDEKCAAIDALIQEKETLIADLEAYKKSLIYECVTGKRRVPDEFLTAATA